MKTSTIAAATATTTVTIVFLVPQVYAGGARSDWSDHYDNIPGAPECWQDGYDDGQNDSFDQDRHEECIFDVPEEVSNFNEPYYEAFIHGCRHAGNTEETCERFTD
jgi:hypothetical protein